MLVKFEIFLENKNAAYNFVTIYTFYLCKIVFLQDLFKMSNLLFSNDDTDDQPQFFVPTPVSVPVVQASSRQVSLPPATHATTAFQPLSSLSPLPAQAKFHAPVSAPQPSRYAATPGMTFIGSAPVSLPVTNSSFSPSSATLPLPQSRAPVLPPHTYNPLPPVQVTHSPQPLPAFNTTPEPVPPPKTSNFGSAPASSVPTLPEDNVVWFYENSVSAKLSDKWLPFSPADSALIESKFNEGITERVKVMSGRYEIDLMDGTRHAQYWAEDPIKIRRGYYYGQVDGVYQPLSEECGEIIDSELVSGSFPKKIPLPGGSNAVMHNSQSVVYLPPGCNPDEQGYVPPVAPQMQFVRRNVRHNELGLRVPPSEPVGAACALILVACDGSAAESSVGLVDSFRNRLLDMRQSHFGHKQRIDILPIIWQGAHSEQLSGTSEVVKELSVSSIPRLREFSSAAIADVMFYSSPIYAQPMIESLTQQLETISGLYREKNTNFSGPIHLIGHGISGLMLFDLLQNQKEKKNSSEIPAPIPSTCTSLKSQPESLSGVRYLKQALFNHYF